jgi:septin family protein
LKKSKSKLRNIITLLGERYSGKTQFFITLIGGKKMRSVPSIHNNKTSFAMNGHRYQMIDYIGDNISKEDALMKLD